MSIEASTSDPLSRSEQSDSVFRLLSEILSLEFKLAKLEAREFLTRLGAPAVFMGVALVCATIFLLCLPAAGVSYLVAAWKWTLWEALLLVGVACFAMALGLAGLAIMLLRPRTGVLH